MCEEACNWFIVCFPEPLPTNLTKRQGSSPSLGLYWVFVDSLESPSPATHLIVQSFHQQTPKFPKFSHHCKKNVLFLTHCSYQQYCFTGEFPGDHWQFLRIFFLYSFYSYLTFELCRFFFFFFEDKVTKQQWGVMTNLMRLSLSKIPSLNNC